METPVPKERQLQNDICTLRLENENLRKMGNKTIDQHCNDMYEELKCSNEHIISLEKENKELREYKIRTEDRLFLLEEQYENITKLYDRIREQDVQILALMEKLKNKQ